MKSSFGTAGLPASWKLTVSTKTLHLREHCLQVHDVAKLAGLVITNPAWSHINLPPPCCNQLYQRAGAHER